MYEPVLLANSWYQHAVEWMEGHLLSCPSKKYLHMDCPGCGFQRSVVALLRAEWHTSWNLYPATVPIILLLLFAALHIKYKFNAGAAIIKYLQISIGIMIFVFYVYKIITLKTFI